MPPKLMLELERLRLLAAADLTDGAHDTVDSASLTHLASPVDCSSLFYI